MKMLNFCVETTYFGLEPDRTQQGEILTIGSSLYSLEVNECMEYFEEMALGF